MVRERLLTAGLSLGLVAFAAGGEPVRGTDWTPRPEPVQSSVEGEVQRLRVEVLAELPHDESAFTQGLEWHEGTLLESVGQYGESALRRVDPASGEVLGERPLDPELFGEGVTRAGSRVIQLTWREGRALLYDAETLEPAGSHGYTGEGWGLCHDGELLVMSDGSSRLTLREVATFRPVGRLTVTLEGRELSGLNELECAEGWVYANVWQTDWVVRIDRSSGEVTALIDASELRRRLGRTLSSDAVLNGIAYRAETASFFLTGKLWPRMFEVIFVD